MKAWSPGRWIVAAMVVLVVAFSAFWNWRPGSEEGLEHEPDQDLVVHQKPEKPAPPDEDYVGSEACQRCHESVAAEYHGHPMSRSLTSISELVRQEGKIEDALIEPTGPRKYRVRYEDGRLWHHEFLPDGDTGPPVYDQAVEVTHAMGSGTRGRAFLLERNGRLFASSLNWFAGIRGWGLAPGYSPERHRRFDRESGDGCLFCHVGRVNHPQGRDDVFGDPIFLETSIGCERCHGPGKRHVQFQERRSAQQSDGAAPSEVDPIVNPSKLDAARREDVCNHCHLQGEYALTRYGRRRFDFRPGMRLDEVLLIFVAGDRVGDWGRTQAVSQVEQMRNSECYLRSDGRMGCLTCHSAHSVPKPEQRDEYYRQRCLTCHESKDCQITEPERRKSQAQDSCSACHMPRLGADLLPHTSQTDHRIVRTPQELRPPTEQIRVEDYRLFDGAESRLPKWEVQRSRGLMLASMAEKHRQRNLSTEAEKLLKSAQQVLGDDPDVDEALAVCLLLQKQDQAASELLTQMLSKYPRRESLILRLAYFSHDHGDLKKAAEYFSRLVEVNPSQADFHGRFAHILGRVGRFQQAIEEAERSIELNPTLSQAHAWLAEAYEAQGLTERSAIHREKAAKLMQAGF